MDRHQRAILRAHRADQKREAAARDSERREAAARERQLVQEVEDLASAFRKGWKKRSYEGAEVKRLYAGMTRKGAIKYKEVVAFLVAAGPTTFPSADGLEIRSYTSCYLLASGGWATAHHGGGSSGDLSPVDSFDGWLKRLRLGQSGPLNVAARSKIRREAAERLRDPNNTPPPKLPQAPGTNGSTPH